MRSGSSGCFGLCLPLPSGGIGGDTACLFRGAVVQVGFNRRHGFIRSCERAFGPETLFSDSFSIDARRSGGSLVDVCGRTLDVGGRLQSLGIFERRVLGLIEVGQYQRRRHKL
jgi:hypothetical protein